MAGACGPVVPKNLRITHVSWSDVGARIEELHNECAFEREEVAAFVRQYLVAVGRLIGPQEHDDHYFRKLLSGHQALLSHMFGVLVNDGDDKVGETVLDRHAHYRATVVRLVRDFGQEPEAAAGSSAADADGSGNEDIEYRRKGEVGVLAELGRGRKGSAGD